MTRYKFCIDVGTQTHGWHFPDKLNGGAASEKQLSPSQTTAGAGVASATSSPSSSTASPEEQRVAKSAPSARWINITRYYLVNQSNGIYDISCVYQ